MIRGSRIRQIGWAALMAACLSAFAALTFSVNAVKSEVRLAERQIVALQKEKIQLETEFESRTNQQQLADWNRIEFGYGAPDADQYLESERELASLGVPRGHDAPNPIRVALAEAEGEAGTGFSSLVSPLTGETFGDSELDQPSSQRKNSERPAGNKSGPARHSLADRLAQGHSLGGQIGEVSE